MLLAELVVTGSMRVLKAGNFQAGGIKTTQGWNYKY
jgi:hypothetical protein